MIFWGFLLGVEMNELGPRFATAHTRVGIGKQLLAEEVFERIGASIIDGTLPPGHRIRDAELAAQFSVSRMPIREALQRLERIGLVEMYPSRYTEVTTVTPEKVAETLEFAGYQAGALARMAAPRLNEQERAEAAGMARALTASLSDGSDISASRWTLFRYLSARSGNAIYANLLDELGMMLFRNLRDWSIPETEREAMAALHEELAEAFLAGDGDAAERVARAMHHVR